MCINIQDSSPGVDHISVGMKFKLQHTDRDYITVMGKFQGLCSYGSNKCQYKKATDIPSKISEF